MEIHIFFELVLCFSENGERSAKNKQFVTGKMAENYQRLGLDIPILELWHQTETVTGPHSG